MNVPSGKVSQPTGDGGGPATRRSGLQPAVKAAVASSAGGFEPLLAAYAHEALDPVLIVRLLRS